MLAPVLRPVSPGYQDPEAHFFESFSWSDEEGLRRLSSDGSGRVFRVVAIHAGLSGNRRMYSAEELKRAARTLIGKPVNLNHNPSTSSGTNVVLDADYEDGAVEAYAYIEDLRILEAYETGEIVGASVEFVDRGGVTEPGGLYIPQGMIMEGLAVVTSPFLPGDGRSSVMLLEMLDGESPPIPLTTQTSETPCHQDMGQRVKKWMNESNTTEVPAAVPQAAGQSNTSSRGVQGLDILATVRQLYSRIASLESRMALREHRRGLVAEDSSLSEGDKEVLKWVLLRNTPLKEVVQVALEGRSAT